MDGLSNGPILDPPPTPPNPKPRVEKSLFQISPNRWEVDEIVNITHYTLTGCEVMRTAFSKSPNEWTHIEHYVGLFPSSIAFHFRFKFPGFLGAVRHKVSQYRLTQEAFYQVKWWSGGDVCFTAFLTTKAISAGVQFN